MFDEKTVSAALLPVDQLAVHCTHLDRVALPYTVGTGDALESLSFECIWAWEQRAVFTPPRYPFELFLRSRVSLAIMDVFLKRSVLAEAGTGRDLEEAYVAALHELRDNDQPHDYRLAEKALVRPAVLMLGILEEYLKRYLQCLADGRTCVRLGAIESIERMAFIMAGPPFRDGQPIPPFERLRDSDSMLSPHWDELLLRCVLRQLKRWMKEP